jgi:hypothetical protein
MLILLQVTTDLEEIHTEDSETLRPPPPPTAEGPYKTMLLSPE